MIYDCFSYWDEDLLLDLRLNILDNYVDYFVIVEGNKTWQNNSKKLGLILTSFKNLKKKLYIYQLKICQMVKILIHVKIFKETQ